MLKIERRGAIEAASNLSIHIDHFKPKGMLVFSPETLALGKGFFGPNAHLYTEAVRRGSPAAPVLESSVDASAIQNVMGTYGLETPDAAKQFYMKQLRTANQTIAYILGVALPQAKQNYSMMDELSEPSENPSYALRWAARGMERSEDQLLYEVGRQHLLAAISGSINARTRDNRIGTVHQSIKEALHDFYERPVAPRSYTLITEHDDETGKVVKVGETEVGVAAKTHIRSHDYKVRSVAGIGPVMVGDRKKGDPEAVLKAIAKAKNNGGWINPDDSTDTFGVKLVVMEPGSEGFEKNVLKLQGELIDHMRSLDRGANRLSNRITGFEIDDDTGTDRASSSNHNFLRLQMHLEGVSVPYEIIFQTAEQMRNDEVMHGVLSNTILKEKQYADFEAETGVNLRGKLYDGSAHALYRAQRILGTLPVIFPKEIYGDGVIGNALDTLHSIESSLRNQDRLPKID